MPMVMMAMKKIRVDYVLCSGYQEAVEEAESEQRHHLPLLILSEYIIKYVCEQDGREGQGRAVDYEN